MLKLWFLSIALLIGLNSFAQTARDIHGTVTDSTKQTLPGSTVKLLTGTDSLTTITNEKGAFVFPAIKGASFSLVIQSIGYDPIKRRFTLDNSSEPVFLKPIILKTSSTLLNTVTISANIPVKIKEDTVEFNAAAYKVRDGAMVEDVIKKLPGADVDKDGNVTFQGKSVTKVRVNGKDFFGGDIKTATQNLPADAVSSVQMINDYGDQANLTGIKSGEPETVLNINVKQNRNHGYFGQVSAGDGADAVPQVAGTQNKDRYIGQGNYFSFSDGRQISVLGNLNNTNTSLFHFGPPGSDQSSSNGITTAKSLGFNYRDTWGKKITVYGSYSFADNSTYTTSNTIQQYINTVNPTTFNQQSTSTNDTKNHRLTFNLEYKIDSINYLKISPSYTFAGTTTNQVSSQSLLKGLDTASAYSERLTGHSSSPSYGINALYNHRFSSRGRNFSINLGAGRSTGSQYQNPVYDYTVGAPTAPRVQFINTSSKTDTLGTSISYIEPLAKKSYLEFDYNYHHAYTSADKLTDTLASDSITTNPDADLSNTYNSTFITNKFGANYRFIDKKFNYTLGVTAEPSLLEGNSPVINPTRVTTFYVSPNAHFVYNVSRSQSFSLNFSGNSLSPSYTQLQPVTDFSNASFPVTGNPHLKPAYSNTLSVRYNKFNFETGNILFSNFSFVQTDNQIVSNTITYPTTYAPNSKLAGTVATRFLNTSGYYTASGFYIFEKPWENRRYRLFLIGNAAYTNNIAYLTSIAPTTLDSTTLRNIAHTLTLSQGLRFRVDITDVVDVEPNTTYSVVTSSNSVSQPGINDNFRTWQLGITGKNYVFKDWTLSYDYNKTFYYGYASAKNPNVFNAYVERRFLKSKQATIRASIFDVFNQNTGYANTVTSSYISQTNANPAGQILLVYICLPFPEDGW